MRNLKLAAMLVVMIGAFSAGRVLGCSPHGSQCSYVVNGCIQGADCPGLPANNFCWFEWGHCCDGHPGDGVTEYCGPSCDAGGTGRCN